MMEAKEIVSQKRELLTALHRELNSGHGVTSIKREEQVRQRIKALEIELDIPTGMITDALGTVWCSACGHKAVDESGKDPVCAYCRPCDLSNFRVEYVAPTKPEHSFEPTCGILADSALGTVRVFDVPDPDENQRAVAEFACRAMNGFDELVAALEQMRNEFSRHTCKYHGPMVCDKCEALRATEKALEVARNERRNR